MASAPIAGDARTLNSLEMTAAALGAINVALVVRRSMLNYPFGIATVSLYFFVFWSARLYSDALLQIFFLGAQLYGWFNWQRSIEDHGTVAVSLLSPADCALWLSITLILSLVWGSAMAVLTDAAAPIPDALIAGMSVAAQLLQSRRKLECWIVWIAVDMVATGLFLGRGLTVTALLYLVFLVLSVIGLIAWQKEWRTRHRQS